MIDKKKLINNTEEVKKKLKTKSFDVNKIDVVAKSIIELNKVIVKIENLQAKRNELSGQVGQYKRDGKDVKALFDKVSVIKDELHKFDKELTSLNQDVDEQLSSIPNLPSDNTPIGKDESENVVIEKIENIGKGLVKQNVNHQDIAEELDIIDFERAVKMSGARFVAYKNKGAKLVRALYTYMLDLHSANGYEELIPPVIVKSSALFGTGQLPKFKDDLFKIENEDKWLIPTGEVPLTNYFANEIIDLSKPKKLTALTQCFRSESGSGGRDNKGIIRMHQFNKVELVKIVNEQDYQKEFESTVDDASQIIKNLEIPFRKLQLCTGDISFTSEETIDLEIWMPSEDTFREVSSISKFGQFQSRRSMIRYKDPKTKYAYTINGSGLAIDRIVAAILENNYDVNTKEITMPNVLIPYLGFDKITK